MLLGLFMKLLKQRLMLIGLLGLLKLLLTKLS